MDYQLEAKGNAETANNLREETNHNLGFLVEAIKDLPLGQRSTDLNEIKTEIQELNMTFKHINESLRIIAQQMRYR